MIFATTDNKKQNGAIEKNNDNHNQVAISKDST